MVGTFIVNLMSIEEGFEQMLVEFLNQRQAEIPNWGTRLNVIEESKIGLIWNCKPLMK